MVPTSYYFTRHMSLKSGQQGRWRIFGYFFRLKWKRKIVEIRELCKMLVEGFMTALTAIFGKHVSAQPVLMSLVKQTLKSCHK